MPEASLADLPAPPEADADSLPAPPAPDTSVKDTAIDVARGVGRGVVERALTVPVFIGDAAVSALNLGAAGLNKLTGQKGKDIPRFSDALEQGLDATLGAPKTKVGKAIEVGSAILSPTTRGVEGIEQALFRSEKLAQLDIAGGKIPESERIRKAGNVAGFKYSPSEVPGAKVSRQVTSLTGKARQEEEISAHNLDKTQELAAGEFNLPPGTELTDEVLDRLEKPAFDTYEKVAQLGQIKTSPEYLADVQKAGSWGVQAETDFPDLPQKVLALRGAMARSEFTGRGALEKLKQLRSDARSNIRSPDPETKSLAKAQKDVADALEKELGRKAQSVGQPQLLEQFKNARKYLAKVNAVRDAIVNGRVSARSLADQLAKGAKLDGNLKIIAESALQNPKSFQDVQKKGRMAAYTVHDLWAMAAGAMGLVTGSKEGMAVAGLAGASLARPIARAAIRSRPVQRAITRPSSQRIGARVSGALAKHPGVGVSAAVQAGMGAEDLGQDQGLGAP